MRYLDFSTPKSVMRSILLEVFVSMRCVCVYTSLPEKGMYFRTMSGGQFPSPPKILLSLRLKLSTDTYANTTYHAFFLTSLLFFSNSSTMLPSIKPSKGASAQTGVGPKLPVRNTTLPEFPITRFSRGLGAQASGWGRVPPQPPSPSEATAGGAPPLASS